VRLPGNREKNRERAEKRAFSGSPDRKDVASSEASDDRSLLFEAGSVTGENREIAQGD
jgi:hypothetical protein